jgi:hypothetical protein
MNTPLPAPFDNPELREKLEEILVRYGVNDRVVHAPIYQIAHLIAPLTK